METIEVKEVRPVRVGDAVRVVDEHYAAYAGLVTAIHGEFSDGFTPCINVVWVSADRAKTDGHGRQLERMSSLQHFNEGPNRMPVPGRYWENL